MAATIEARSAAVAPPAGSRRRAATAGVRDMLPLLAGMVPFALVVGAKVADSAVDPVVGWSTAWTVYGGSVQLATVNLLDQGAPLAVMVATVAIINLRLVAYSAVLAPHWSAAPRWWKAVACYLLVEPSFALARRHADRSPAPAEHRAYYLGAGLTLWVGWLTACAVGIVAGGRLVDVVPAELVVELLLLGLVGPVLARRGGRCSALVAAAVAVPAVALPMGTGTLVAATVGAAVALLVEAR